MYVSWGSGGHPRADCQIALLLSKTHGFNDVTQNEFEALIGEPSKRIVGNIEWGDDEDHSPSVEFRAEVESDPGYPISVRGSYNSHARALSFTLVHRSVGRIFALDVGKDHHNPDCNRVGDMHLHSWTEQFRDKVAMVPAGVTATFDDPRALWQQFCSLAGIRHDGEFPPPRALENGVV